MVVNCLSIKMQFHQFKHPFTMLIAGPSSSGKTTFVRQMLLNKRKMFDVDFDRIIWCYSVSNSIPDIPDINEFHHGVPENFTNDRNEKILYVLDDLMDDVSNSESISNLYTKHSHHLGISVCVITQNLYQKGSHFRTISLNSKYLVVFKSPRDTQQFGFLARQLAGNHSNDLVRVFNEICSRPRAYLMIDLTQDIIESLRYRTDIFDNYHSGVVYCNLSQKDARLKMETFGKRQVFALYN